MAMTDYGRNFYASLIVGKETSIGSLYLALCNVMPTAASTGATISEGPGTRTLLCSPSMSTSWSAPADGLTSFLDPVVITATESDSWGTIVGYALCDAAAAGTGNVLFYGSLPPFTVSASLVYLDIQGIQLAVA